MDRRRAGALLALAACIACSAAAPTTSNHTALDLYDGAPEGCYYNFQHYGEGDRIMTNEPCLNCTCHNRMLMCYLRVCPFTKPIGQDCTIEKRADQCCPIVTCPDVPVDLLTSTSTTSPAEYGATGVGKHDKYGCSMNGKYFPEGSKVPPTPNKPCEHCYCIRNMTTCVMQECTLHVDGCTPIYHKDVCCPVRYSCDHPEDEMPLLDDMSTTVRPTPGFLLTTTTIAPVTQMTQDCVHDDRIFADGALIKTEKACEHCYCMKGDIVCVVQECGTPMENEGKNCTSLPPREGQCCPDTYICEGDELGTEPSTEITTESVVDTATTLLPPRRTGIEGSGYRNEPDEDSYTGLPDREGSGEGQVTLAPYDSTEKLASEKTDEPIVAIEEGTTYTTKSPSFGEPEDTTDNKILSEIEPQEYIPAATDVPMETGDEIYSTEENLIQEGVTEKESLASHETISTTLAPEIFDKITTDLGDALNTVPDSINAEEDIDTHKHIPSPTVSSVEESERTTPSISDGQIAVSGLSEDKINKPEFTFPSTTMRADESSDTTKENDVINLDLTTGKEISEPEQYAPSTPSSSIKHEIETGTPEVYEHVTTENIVKENEGTKPDAYESSTISIPIQKGEEATTEPDHDQNTVAVVEEDNIQPHLHTTTTRTSLEKEEGATLHSIELGSGSEENTEENILEQHEYEHATTASPSEKDIMKTTAEPDKGLNTIPGDLIEESSSKAPVPESTLAHETIVTDSDDSQGTESIPTIASDSSTLSPESTVSRADHFTVTTEPSFRKEDESIISTEKIKESPAATTDKNDFTDEGFIPTSVHDDKLSSGPSAPTIDQEFTTFVPDNEVEMKEPTTESILVSSVSSATLPEKLPELPSEQGTEFIYGTPTTEKSSDITTSMAEIGAQEEPARIPGEGDCLLNGITYRNNSVVPSTNNCHSGCKCLSSIIKCDPIICSPPPDYMDNCQSIYDSPDSCCPTYVCDHPRETVPPQSDNQMSGTESPQHSHNPAIECRGDQCEISVDIKHPGEPSDKPYSNDCGPEGCQSITQKPDEAKYSLEHPEGCKDGKCPSPEDDCSNGKCVVPATHELVCDPEHGCQAVPVKPCEGEHCKVTIEDVGAQPPQLCVGDSCKFEVSSPQDTQQVPCKEEDGCKSEQKPPHDCTGDSCRRNEIPDIGHNLPSECEGSQCVQKTQTTLAEGTHHMNTESSMQKQTPFELITEKLETIEGEHKPTESHKELEMAVTEQSNIPDVQKEMETKTPEEKRTTLSGSYATESDKSQLTTENTIIPVTRDNLESQTIASPDKDLSLVTPRPIPEIYATESHNIVTETSNKQDMTMGTTTPSTLVGKDDKTPSSDKQTTDSENIYHERTTVSYSTETVDYNIPVHGITQSEVTQSHEFGTQSTQFPLVYEVSTGVPLSEIKPVSDVNEQMTTLGVESDTEKPAHDFGIPETSVTIDSEGTVSKITDLTTEAEYGFTDTPEYESPDTNVQETGPVKIEPQEGTTESQKSPTIAGETTRRTSEITEYITEKDQIRTELPIEMSHVTELIHDTEQYDVKPEQPITEVSPVIEEHSTENSLPSTAEPEKSFTEIEDTFVTGQDPTTTEKSIPKATISVEYFDKSTELIEPSTTEKIHEIVEMSLSSSETALYPDSQLVGVTKPLESTTKTTEQVVTDQPQELESEMPALHELPEIKLPEKTEQSEKPETEEEDQSTTLSVTEKDIHTTSQHLTTESHEFITKQPHQYEDTTEDAKSPPIESQKLSTESPITSSMESLKPVDEITGHEEKTTYIPEGEDIQVHLSTKTPEIITSEHVTDKELPQKEYSNIPGSYVTESYETETQDVSTTLEESKETELLKTTTEVPSSPAIKEVSTGEGESNKQKQSTDSSMAIEDIRTESPVTQIITKLPESIVTEQQDYIGTASLVPVATKDETTEPGQTTLSKEEVSTESTVQHLPESLETITKTPEDTDDKYHVTEAPVNGEEPEPGRTGLVETITKVPDDIKDSQAEVTGDGDILQTPEDAKKTESETTSYEEGITNAPEDTTKESQYEITKQDTATKAPEDTKETYTYVTLEEDNVTKAPEVMEESEAEVTRRKEDSHKMPEVIKESYPGVTVQDVATVTKGPEVTKESESELTSQESEVTTAPGDKQQTGVQFTGPGEKVTIVSEDTSASLPEITQVPDDMKHILVETTKLQEEVTKAPEDSKQSVLKVTRHEEEVTRAPEYTEESLPEITGQEEKATEAPKDTKESLAEFTKQGEEVTKAPMDLEESLPEIIAQEEGVSKAPEDTKESLPEITGQEEGVTKAPEDTKESLPEITGQEEGVTKAPEDTKESLSEITGQVEGVTKAPEDTKESLPEMTKPEQEVTKDPEYTKEPLPEITAQEEGVTKSPEDTKESLPEITGQEEGVTKAPEDTKEPLPEITGQEEGVTKAPEDTKEPLPEITGQEEGVTKAPEDTKEPLPEITGQEEGVTKAPEDAKESLSEITGQVEGVTKAPEVTKESLPEITGQEEGVTKAPEDTKESLPEITGLEEGVTKAPEVTKESVTEITGQEEGVTKAPEDMKESLPEITGLEEGVTQAPEDTKEPLPEITGQEEGVTKAPEDTKEPLSEITGQEEGVTKAPEDTKEPLPEITGQEEGVTKAPEDTKEPLPEITGQEEGVTKAPEDTKEPLPEITGQEEGVTKAPEDTKEPLHEITGQEEGVTKAPEDTKESLPEITGQGEAVTKAPEDTKESLSEITGQGEEVTNAPEDTKVSLQEITGQEEEITKSPVDMKESLPEVTKQEQEVTKAPGYTKEPLPEIAAYEEGVTKAPEDMKESLPDMTGLEEGVTKVPEDIKESLPETTKQEQELTTAPEYTKESLPEVTGQEEGLTKAPEDTEESQPVITKEEQQVTKGPAYTKEPLPEITGQEQGVTKAPEDTKVSLPEITGHEEGVTKTPEDTKEPLPEITGEEEGVTKAPEDTKEPLPEFTGQEEGVTKAPEDTKESLPDITGQGEEVTKAPEDKKESLPEITDQAEKVTKAPQEKNELLPELTGQGEEATKAPEDMTEMPSEVPKLEEEVTKAPEDSKDSIPDITRQGEQVTKAPEDTKETLSEITEQEDEVTKVPEITEQLPSEIIREEEKVTKAPEVTQDQEAEPAVTSEEDNVTKIPEGVKHSEPEVDELSPEDVVTEKHESTPMQHDIHLPQEVVTESTLGDNNISEDTTPQQVVEIGTEQPKDKISETTPDVIILEEHTHKIMEESSTASPAHEERTTVYIDTEAPLSDIASQKPTERIETVTKEVEITTKADEGIPTVDEQILPQSTLATFDQVTEKVQESPVPTEETSLDHNIDEAIKQKEPTSALVSEETTPAVLIDTEKSPVPEFPIQHEKLPSPTEKPVHHEIVNETTTAEDVLEIATTKATTTKQEEVAAMADDKPTKPEDKPAESSEVTPTANIPESAKPIPSETQSTDELPTPEDDSNFPPTGMSGYGEPDYVEEDQAFGPGTCRYGGKVYVSAQQIPRDDPCDFCFCFRSDIICLQQSCPPPIHGCHEEPIQGFCCPRYECPVSMATTINMTTTTTTTTTTLPPHFPTHSYKGAAQRRGCQIKGHTYKVGEVVRSSSGPCLHCTCGGDGQMKCDPKACTPEPMLRQMIAAAVSAKRRR